jgi:hypothetical protein
MVGRQVKGQSGRTNQVRHGRSASSRETRAEPISTKHHGRSASRNARANNVGRRTHGVGNTKGWTKGGMVCRGHHRMRETRTEPTSTKNHGRSGSSSREAGTEQQSRNSIVGRGRHREKHGRNQQARNIMIGSSIFFYLQLIS